LRGSQWFVLEECLRNAEAKTLNQPMSQGKNDKEDRARSIEASAF
jgi:hypothetical protein